MPGYDWTSAAASAGAGKSIGTLKADIGLDTRGLHSGVQSARSGLDQLRQSFGSLQGMLAGIGLSLGIASVVRGVVAAGKEFDSEMTRLRTAVGDVREEFSAYRKEAMDVGMRTEYSAAEVSSAINLLKRSGYDMRETIGAIPTAVTLAMIAERGLAETTKVLTGTLSAMDLPVSRAANLTDQLAIAHATAKGDVYDYMEALVAVAPIAKSYGYSIEETIGYLMKLAQNEIYGAEAGQKLGMTMAKSNEAAEKFGYSSADILDVLAAMNAEGKTGADVMREYGLRFGKTALIIGDSANEIRDFQERLKNANGEGKDMAAMLDTRLSEGLDRLRAQLSTVSDYIFQLFAKDAKKAIEDLHSWILRNRDDIVGFAYAMVTAFKAIGAVVEVVLTPLAGLISGIGSHFRDAARDAERSADDIGASCRDIRDSVTEVSEATSQMPEFTSADRFVATWKIGLGNMAAQARAVGRIAAAAFQGFFETVWSGLESTAAQFMAFRKLVLTNVFDPAALEENWQALLAAHQSGLTKFVNVQKDVAKEISSAISEAVSSVTIKSPVDYLAEQWGKQHAPTLKATLPIEYDYETTIKGLQNAVDEARGHWKKVQTDEDAAKKKAEEYYQTLGRMSDVIRDFASEESASVDERIRRWEDYRKVMEQIIALDEKKRISEGMSAKMSAEVAAKARRDLERERVQLLEFTPTELPIQFNVSGVIDGLRAATEEARIIYEGNRSYQNEETKRLLLDQQQLWDEHGVWLRQWARDVGDQTAELMGEGMFRGLKGDWTDWKDWVKDWWDNLLRSFTYALAREMQQWMNEFMKFEQLKQIFQFAYNGPSVVGTTSTGMPPGAGPVEMARGAVAMGPTYALIAEREPEAVVPLQRYERLVASEATGTDGKSTNIVFNVTTPDIASFKASKSQIMSRLGVDMILAARRNG